MFVLTDVDVMLWYVTTSEHVTSSTAAGSSTCVRVCGDISCPAGDPTDWLLQQHTDVVQYHSWTQLSAQISTCTCTNYTCTYMTVTMEYKKVQNTPQLTVLKYSFFSLLSWTNDNLGLLILLFFKTVKKAFWSEHLNIRLSSLWRSLKIKWKLKMCGCLFLCPDVSFVVSIHRRQTCTDRLLLRSAPCPPWVTHYCVGNLFWKNVGHLCSTAVELKECF